MKKYIGFVLLLCMCLLGGCAEEKGKLEFLVYIPSHETHLHGRLEPP